MSTFWRYLKIQAFVLLCGIVGPIFLIVYFAAGADPTLKWMFWTGLAITAADVLIALALTHFGTRAAARKAALERDGVLALARITGIDQTGTRINDQPLVKLDLQISAPELATFTGRDRVIASVDRLPMITGRNLVALVDPATGDYQIDWERSALIAGLTPVTLISDSDGTGHDLSGQVEPLMQILRILKAHGIAPAGGVLDLRDHPGARHQVQAVLRQATTGSARAPLPGAVGGAPVLSTGQRLQELEALRSSGVITESEYQTKRAQIIAEL